MMCGCVLSTQALVTGKSVFTLISLFKGMWMERITWRMWLMLWKRLKRKSSSLTGGEFQQLFVWTRMMSKNLVKMFPLTGLKREQCESTEINSSVLSVLLQHCTIQCSLYTLKHCRNNKTKKGAKQQYFCITYLLVKGNFLQSTLFCKNDN